MWAPQPGPQTEAIGATWCPELFFGGAAGGGKSDFLLGDYLQDVPTYGQAWRGILLRQTYPELEELLSRAREFYPSTGATWLEQKRTWTWSNGAHLKLRYCETDADVARYLGHQYTWIGWDEVTRAKSLFPYRYLRARLRSAHKVPTKRIRAAGNPGGPAHLEVKSYFIDPAPEGFVPIHDPVTGMERMFVPSRLKDNHALMANDPDYRGRVAGLGGQLAKAMLDGDWNVIDGAFFDGWSVRNIIRPIQLPKDWTRFRSFDWGSARPFSVGWWAIAGDDFETPEGLIPRGALVRYREWYGSTGEPNEGLKMTAEQVAHGIADREKGDTIAYGVADPAMFAEDGGPSIAERMALQKVHFRRADNKRVATAGAMGGWDQFRARMLGEQDDEGGGRPMLFVFETCRDFIRTVPVLQHDRDRPEDLDSDGEDHVADEARYACMSRPYVRSSTTPKPRERYSGRKKTGGGAWAA